MGESLTASGDKNGDVEESSTRSCTTQLEAASCNSTLREFCCIYPDMCGEDAELQTCSSVTTDQAEFCADSATSKYCCGVDSTDDEVTE